MKLRVSLTVPGGATRDISIECDVTTTVADTARALIRASESSDPQLEETARQRLAPITLRAHSPTLAPPLLLDPASPIGSSGLQTGWTIEPVLEFEAHAESRRITPVAGYIEVRNGRHAGVHFSLIRGINLIGRERNSRVYLSDPSVSRRHASFEIEDRILVRDLGSVNGTRIGGELLRGSEVSITRTCDVKVGEVTLRVFPGAIPTLPKSHTHRIVHTRSPRIAPRFLGVQRELPAPPEPSNPSRIPMLAMLAPMAMGGAMYMITRSPMSLMMAAFSPIMMIGAWIDGKFGSSRRFKREFGRFKKVLEAERHELLELQAQEVRIRSAETPTLHEVSRAINERDGLLWTRRPEHRNFLEIRFGTGTLRSRTHLVLPARGEAAQEQWESLRLLEARFCDVTPVPVLERFERCGSIGVAGPRCHAESMARSIVVQLVGLHSPDELAIACFAGRDHPSEWGWLKWLPHVNSAASPLGAWQLATGERGSIRLLVALEQLLEERLRAAPARKTVRSHQTITTKDNDERDEAVTELPITPAVVVLVLDGNRAHTSRLVALAEHGPDVGIHLIWVATEGASVPAACRTFVELHAHGGRINFVRSGVSVPLSSVEFISSEDAAALARTLGPVEDAGTLILEESDLPKNIDLREFHPVDLLGGSAQILETWARSGSLTSHWRQGTERDPLSLDALVGQGPNGPVSIDLRAHGPHALVGGTTGSGKSEFLQTWIMSMAVNVSPDRLNFLLVDYKGGAAFAECTDLPHTVGLVTDLSPHLVRRALTSLRAELRYREELLARHGAKDLSTMERRSDPAAPPALVIVIDEFAALATDVPEFVEGIVDIAQRGRSLGLHLIMATQRPAGVIKDNLRANTNLRVALRMADESDSSDVIGVKEAAFFDIETPGRGAMKIGPGRISNFQAGYLGGRAAHATLNSRLEVRSLNFSQGEPWDIPPEVVHSIPARRDSAISPRDIELLRDGIVDAALAAGLTQPRRPWQDELPKTLDLDGFDGFDGLGDSDPAGLGVDTVAIGLRDVPSEQSRRPVLIDFDDVGNLSFVGAGGTGKTTALITVAVALSDQARSHPIHLYAIDAAGGALDAIGVLPTVGGVAHLSDSELVRRVLQHLLSLIEERGPRYAAARAASYGAYRRTQNGANEPRVVLLLDGLAAFRQSAETVAGADVAFDALNEIMMAGRSVGVHVVLTVNRPAAVPASMASSLQQQIVLRLAGAHEYGHLGINGETLEGAAPGRAVLAGSDEELQIALIGGEPDLSAQAKCIEVLAAKLHTQGVTPAKAVRNAPERIRLEEMRSADPTIPVVGIDTRSFAPLEAPWRGLAVVAGPAGSGKSTASLAIVEALERWAENEGNSLDTVLLTFDNHGLHAARRWDRVACGEEGVTALAEDLVKALGGKPRGARAGLVGVGRILGSEQNGSIGTTEVSHDVKAVPSEEDAEKSAASSTPVFPSGKAHGVIVVERPGDAEDTAALPLLVALAKTARRANVLVVFEFEPGTAAGVWELFSALKQPRWGLALQPDDGESQSPFRESFGRVKRADFPPGRGFIVEGGRVTPVHVGLPQAQVWQPRVR